MIRLFLERLALLGALSTIVIAALWAHIGPKVQLIARKFFSLSIIDVLQGQSEVVERTTAPNQHQPHPSKLSGRPFRQTASAKESIGLLNSRSLGKWSEVGSQSPLAARSEHRPGLASQSSSGQLAGFPATALNSFGQLNQQHDQYHQGQQYQQSSPAFLIIFTITIIGLILYTMMSYLSARFHSSERSWSARERRNLSSGCVASQAGRFGEASDLGRDKRKLAKLSREERVRQLIKHHGGRNVSSAIRFLACELGKQKRQLFESLLAEQAAMALSSSTDVPAAEQSAHQCGCLCHQVGQTKGSAKASDLDSKRPYYADGPAPGKTDLGSGQWKQQA